MLQRDLGDDHEKDSAKLLEKRETLFASLGLLCCTSGALKCGGCGDIWDTEDERTTRAAFVTFNRAVTAAVACQSQVRLSS
jgi:hypothetical protein